jgi:transposase
VIEYKVGIPRNQIYLFQHSLEELIEQDNLVRFIDGYVESLDMGKLKIYIYGYFNRIRTSRLLETECGRNQEMMWLVEGLRPDFKTIAEIERAVERGLGRYFEEMEELDRRQDHEGIQIRKERVVELTKRIQKLTRKRQKVNAAKEFLEKHPQENECSGSDPDSRLRQEALPEEIRDTAWKAQLRLCARCRRMLARGKNRNLVITAIARELVAFIGAIAKKVPRAEAQPVAQAS